MLRECIDGKETTEGTTIAIHWQCKSYNEIDMDRWLEVGLKMGLEGKELQSFVSEQLVIERNERQRECKFKKAQMEARRHCENMNMSENANERKSVGNMNMN